MKTRQDAWTDENDLLLAETVLRHVREGSTQLNAFEEVGDKLDRTSAACGFRWNAVVRHNYEKALQLAKKQRKQRQRILGKDQGGKKKLLYNPPVPTLDESLTGSLPAAELSDEGQPTFDLSLLEQDDKQIDAALMADLQDLVNKEKAQKDYSVESAEEMAEMPAQAAPTQVSHTAPVRHTVPPTGLTMGHVIAYLQSLNGSSLQVDIYKSENERLKREIHSLRKQNEELQQKINRLEENTNTMQEDYETLMKIMNRARKLALFEEEERPATKFKMDRNGNLEKVAE
ncbi:RsfA family transcriptional regulator [Bacillus sp. ISL-35]|uniref:RsfA family transcriptional regulator n=1 Tax=Bacillus sp. ISL-35 TaxID=2819122 RepID=UPI001BE7910A|nr:RsfA family transcriptional regulator [Bacillus sp. ISL-35]MBT2681823.1 RsfA family transcriptional regulator [Bacillus sp. ISL-35]MBT2706203.1 RsfA family transcriptional regulator [Chryseobacterium sp. ISL-80]